MAEDAIVADQAMDIDNNASPVPSAGGTSAATSRSPLRARRNISNPTEKRRNLGSHKVHPDAKIQKSSFNTKTNLSKFYGYRLESGQRGGRKQRIQRAIADGSFQYRDWVPRGQEGELQQVKRLDANLVAAAMFEPVPGMTFDPAAPSAFNNQADMADLVQALEAFQMHLARKGKVVLSEKAGPLLRGFARDVLAAVLYRPDGSGRTIGADGFWECVASDYQTSKKVKWFAVRVMDSFDPIMRGDGLSLRSYMKMVLETMETPSKHPKITEVLTEAIKEIPSFIVAQPSTLQALMSHFEAARARYLADLKTAHGPSTASNPAYHQKDAAGFGKLPRSDDGQDDSSEDENDGLRGGVFDGGVEDDGGQIEEGVPSNLTQWFLVKLDKWTASKNEQQQEGVDVNMLSALDLGDGELAS